MLTRKYHHSNSEHPAPPTPNMSRKPFPSPRQSQLPHFSHNSSSQSRVRRSPATSASFQVPNTANVGEITSSDDESSASLSLSPSPPALSPASSRASNKKSLHSKSSFERETKCSRDIKKTDPFDRDCKKSRDINETRFNLGREIKETKDKKQKDICDPKSKWGDRGFTNEEFQACKGTQGRVEDKLSLGRTESRSSKDIWELRMVHKDMGSISLSGGAESHKQKESWGKRNAEKELRLSDVKDLKGSKQLSDLQSSSKDAWDSKDLKFNAIVAKDSKGGETRQVWDGDDKTSFGGRNIQDPYGLTESQPVPKTSQGNRGNKDIGESRKFLDSWSAHGRSNTLVLSFLPCTFLYTFIL